MATHYKYVIGRAEPIDILVGDNDITGVPAKIDSGAFSSSIWATNIREENGGLTFSLLGPTHEAYTGEDIHVTKYQMVKIENSFSKSETRYGVMLKVKFCGKKITTFFTLADRSKKIYPVLIGRKLLKGRFLVDVSIGNPIADEETEENLGFVGLKNRVRKRK